MPVISLHSVEADHLYKILGQADSWESDTEKTQESLKKLSVNTSMQDNQLMNKSDSKILL